MGAGEGTDGGDGGEGGDERPPGDPEEGDATWEAEEGFGEGEEGGGGHAGEHAGHAARGGGPAGEHAQEEEGQEGALEEGEESLEGFEDGAETLLDGVTDGDAAQQEDDHEPAAEDEAFAVGGVGAEEGAVEVSDDHRAGGVHVGVEVGEDAGEEGAEDEAEHAGGEEADDEHGEDAVAIPVLAGGTEFTGEEAEGDEAWDDQEEGEDELEGGAEDIGSAGFVLGAGAESALDDGLVADPVGGTEDESETEEDGGPGVDGVVGRGQELEVMACPVEASDGFLELRPAADLLEAEDTEEGGSGDEDDAGEGVGGDDGFEAPPGGVEADEGAGEEDGGPEVPAEEGFEHGGGADQNGAEGADHEEDPEEGEEGADGLVVAAAEVFGDGVDAGQPEEGHEEEGGDEDREDAADEIEVHHDEAVAVGIAGQAHHVFGADVGDDEGEAGGPPGEGLASQEVAFAVADAAADPDPEGGHADEVGDDQGEVEGREFDRHGGVVVGRDGGGWGEVGHAKLCEQGRAGGALLGGKGRSCSAL